MKINLTGDNEVRKGTEILAARLGYELSADGMKVVAVKRCGNLEVVSDGKSAEIYYEEKVHFFRGLGILCQHFGDVISICEDICFTKNGLMIDASRNAVMKESSIKDFIEIMAVMGLNVLMMYTEDTYEVPEYPYFGYMRGRYTYDELKSCDDHADIFGIEMLPCIQLMAHMCKALKWWHGLDIKDTDDNLYAGSEDTYIFIRHLLTAATAPYRSNRIHIGMDEAWTLGLGKSLSDNGYRSSSDIIKEHFSRVKDIVDELNLEPVMWSDMFFRAGSANRVYYNPNAEFDSTILEAVPQNTGLIYWDYYHNDEKFYSDMLSKHKELSDNIIFAGGIWLWNNMNVNYKRTLSVSIPALRACKKNNIREVFATIWGDNGNQANIYEALYGMQLYAEMGYGHDADEEWLEERFYACTGEKAESFLRLGLLDDIGQENFDNANPSQYLLWQDILLGFADYHIDCKNLADIYRERAEIFKKCSIESRNYSSIFEYAQNLANVLEIKADLGVKLKAAYDTEDRTALKQISDIDLPELINRLWKFKRIFRDLWFSTYKPFGFEVIDMRFGALFSRIETVQYRISNYLKGETDKLDELEQKRLPYRIIGGEFGEGLNLRVLDYQKFVTAGYCSQDFFD